MIASNNVRETLKTRSAREKLALQPGEGQVARESECCRWVLMQRELGKGKSQTPVSVQRAPAKGVGDTNDGSSDMTHQNECPQLVMTMGLCRISRQMMLEGHAGEGEHWLGQRHSAARRSRQRVWPAHARFDPLQRRAALATHHMSSRGGAPSRSWAGVSAETASEAAAVDRSRRCPSDSCTVERRGGGGTP